MEDDETELTWLVSAVNREDEAWFVHLRPSRSVPLDSITAGDRLRSMRTGAVFRSTGVPFLGGNLIDLLERGLFPISIRVVSGPDEVTQGDLFVEVPSANDTGA